MFCHNELQQQQHFEQLVLIRNEQLSLSILAIVLSSATRTENHVGDFRFFTKLYMKDDSVIPDFIVEHLQMRLNANINMNLCMDFSDEEIS